MEATPNFLSLLKSLLDSIDPQWRSKDNIHGIYQELVKSYPSLEPNNVPTDMRDKFFDDLTRKREDGLTDFNCMPHNVFEWIEDYFKWLSHLPKVESQEVKIDYSPPLTEEQEEIMIKQNIPIAESIGDSWLDHHILNEDSEIDGVIIKHAHAPETYGGVSVKTDIGNFAIVKEDQEKAAKNKGETVRVKPHKDYYGTVIILHYGRDKTQGEEGEKGKVLSTCCGVLARVVSSSGTGDTTNYYECAECEQPCDII